MTLSRNLFFVLAWLSKINKQGCGLAKEGHGNAVIGLSVANISRTMGFLQMPRLFVEKILRFFENYGVPGNKEERGNEVVRTKVAGVIFLQLMFGDRSFMFTTWYLLIKETNYMHVKLLDSPTP